MEEDARAEAPAALQRRSLGHDVCAADSGGACSAADTPPPPPPPLRRRGYAADAAQLAWEPPPPPPRARVTNRCEQCCMSRCRPRVRQQRVPCSRKLFFQCPHALQSPDARTLARARAAASTCPRSAATVWLGGVLLIIVAIALAAAAAYFSHRRRNRSAAAVAPSPPLPLRSPLPAPSSRRTARTVSEDDGSAPPSSAPPSSSLGGASVCKRLSFGPTPTPTRAAAEGAAAGADAAPRAREDPVSELGAALGRAAGAALAPHVARTRRDEEGSVEASDASAPVPASGASELERRVCAAAAALARHTGVVLSAHALLPAPALRGAHDSDVEDDAAAAADASGAHAAAPQATPANMQAHSPLSRGDGRRFVAAFCAAFEGAALCRSGECDDDNDAGSDADAEDAVCSSMVLARHSVARSPLAGSLGAPADLRAQLVAVAAGVADASPLQLTALQILLAAESNSLSAAHLDVRRASTAVAAAKLTHTVSVTTEATRRNDEAAMRASATDALCTALGLGGALLGARGWRTAVGLRATLSACSLGMAPGERAMWRHMLRSLTEAANCALAAMCRACGAAVVLAICALLALRWACAPGAAAASASAAAAVPRVTALLLLSAAVCHVGGGIVRVLGGSALTWQLTWAPLLIAHLALQHSIVVHALLRALAPARAGASVALWAVVACAWPCAAAWLPFLSIDERM
jgi:hypothetical protein